MSGLAVSTDLKRETSAELTRYIGRFGRKDGGPRLICLAGLHGNEWAGVHALQRIFSHLQQHNPDFQGEIVGLCGHLPALISRQRFFETDLNRVWIPERLAALRAGVVNSVEDAEQLDLLHALDKLLDHNGRPVYFMDLHTMSAPGQPFVLTGDTLRNRHFAQSLGVPTILGLEEQLPGTITEYLNDRGAITVGFESGQHDDPQSIDLHEAAIWMAVRSAGLWAGAGENGPCARSAVRLRAAAAGCPSVFEVRYRHEVHPGDGFRMEPGFANFSHVEAGQVVASDVRGPIVAFETGCLLLPLYQEKGDDGFFLGRPIKPFWLKVSEWMRKCRLDVTVPLLPGVRRAPFREGTLIVDPSLARWFVIEIFHLLGFRRRRDEDGMMVFSRRRFDVSE